jgi:hypothetical protein
MQSLPQWMRYPAETCLYKAIDVDGMTVRLMILILIATISTDSWPSPRDISPNGAERSLSEKQARGQQLLRSRYPTPSLSPSQARTDTSTFAAFRSGVSECSD